VAEAEELAGKRFLVTGATGGIGSRVCALIGGRGGQVHLLSRNAEKLSLLDSQVNGPITDTSRVCVVDFASPDSTRACAAILEQLEEPLDGAVIIVPSAPKSRDRLPTDHEWRAALDLCFVNPLTVLRSVVPSIAHGGRIVIVSGIATKEVFPSLPFSNVIRLAWLAEAKRLSFVLGDRRIRVNTVSLGATLTEQLRRRLDDRREHDVPDRESLETIPLGEYGHPEDAAHVVVSLLSTFSNHITGVNIPFDGGLTRGY
jgi:3-oxoacyl-[acyl-carrier protein] reductase